ncbi:GNAT family N-acetyltransferase [Fictibacillus aquaticus]|uniref:GNAT family N-acetyltransferase n=1 Tax=Fictibacillus aquaticus TaxID=2021314 RepID=A0A235FDM0_9BACL|nr:GNAT family N-acetyltransferase [Fictibacillus aquaticus]OYD59500.1 GNAT family N-acetyltransferase [Fictibacillus aquaticus]
MEIVDLQSIPREIVVEFFVTHWGSPEMVISTGVFDCSLLEGFAAVNEEGQIQGMVTYHIEKHECEIISLDSIAEGKGIGTSLVKKVEEAAQEKKCTALKLITTNDNLNALKFYQKRGFFLSKLLPNAVSEARKLKPQIPLVGNDGIPIRDEIELKKQL